MPTVSATQLGVPRSVDEELLELVCADEEFLRAEFDAIIAEEWPTNPPTADPPGAAPAPAPRQGWRPAPLDFRAGRGQPRHPGIGGWSRQRSPPRHTTAPPEYHSESNDQDGRR